MVLFKKNMWLTNYLKKHSYYDIILSSPFLIKEEQIKDNFFKNKGNFLITFSNLKNKDEISLNLLSFLKEFSFGQSVQFKKKKGISGKKIYSFSSLLRGQKLFNFLDFFLTVILKSIRRKFIVYKFSINDSGILYINFSSLSELDIDEYLFFFMDEWSGTFSLTINFNYGLKKSFSKYFIKIFRLSRITNV